MRNIFSVDLEDWFHANFDGVEGPADRRPSPYLRRQTLRLLDLLARASVRATFFTLGEIVEADPWFARVTAEAGHEVASHGFDHRLVGRMTREEFSADVSRSLRALASAGVPRVRGYRAPSWSLDPRRADLFEVLAGLDIEYDASLFPLRTFLYGDSQAPTRPFVTHAGVREFPSSVVEIGGFRWSVFGGFYLRSAPYAAIKWAMRRLQSEGRPAIIYIHPREIDPGHPRLRLGPRDHLIHYFNLRRTEAKLRQLLRDFEFGSFAEVLLSDR